jgi:hypothetical protein
MISIYLTVLIGLILLRIFVTAVYMIGGKKTKLTDNERLFIGVSWVIISVITTILFLQEVIFV